MMRKGLLFLTLAVCLVSCRQESVYYTVDGFAIGTTYHIVMEKADTTGFTAGLYLLMEEVNNSMSIYRENSLINRLNRNETDMVDDYIKECITIAEQVSRASGGKYDITIKPVTEAWGFNEKEAVTEPNLDSLMRYVGYGKIRIEGDRLIKDLPEIKIELNSVAKGYIVDLVGDYVRSYGIENYLVEIGGEIRCEGVNRTGNRWTIGIDRPLEGNFIPGADLQVKIELTDCGLATSGNYRRFYIDGNGRKVVHTIDATTGMYKDSNLLSATVVAPTSALADALGTMLMAVGFEEAVSYLERNTDIGGYLIYSDGNGDYMSYVTDNLKDRITEY